MRNNSKFDDSIVEIDMDELKIGSYDKDKNELVYKIKQAENEKEFLRTQVGILENRLKDSIMRNEVNESHSTLCNSRLCRDFEEFLKKNNKSAIEVSNPDWLKSAISDITNFCFNLIKQVKRDMISGDATEDIEKHARIFNNRVYSYFEELKVKFALLENSRQTLSLDYGRCRADYDISKTKCDELVSENVELKKQIDCLNILHAHERSIVNSVKNEINILRQQLQLFKHRNDDQRAQIDGLLKKVNELKSAGLIKRKIHSDYSDTSSGSE